MFAAIGAMGKTLVRIVDPSSLTPMSHLRWTLQFLAVVHGPALGLAHHIRCTAALEVMNTHHDTLERAGWLGAPAGVKLSADEAVGFEERRRRFRRGLCTVPMRLRHSTQPLSAYIRLSDLLNRISQDTDAA